MIHDLIRRAWRGAGRVLLCGWLLSTAPALAVQDEGGDDFPIDEDEWVEPEWRLEPPPVVNLDLLPRAATDEEIQRIEALIDRLADIEDPDFGMAPWMSGSQFAPIAESREFGGGIIMIDHGLKTNDALTELVALGPMALPHLLRALDNQTPTKLAMDHGGGMGGQWYGREVFIHRASPREVAVRDAHPEFFAEEGDIFGEANVSHHQITIGDVAFVIIGQIVNRPYEAARYQPTACRVINSPTHDPELARLVHEIWQGDDAAKTLLDSLLTDFQTRGWGSEAIQAGAAMRLLFYFPEIADAIVAGRIESLDLTEVVGEDDWVAQEERNGLRPADLLEAARPFDRPALNDALFEAMDRAEDSQAFHAALTPAVVARDPERVFQRMREFVSTPPEADAGPFGSRYHVLRSALAHFPDSAEVLFQTYLAHETLGTTRATVHALAEPSQKRPWMIEFLSARLDDTTDTGWQFGPEHDRKPIRICDEAAKTLADDYLSGVRFEYEEDSEFLDAQIAKIKRVLAGETGITFEGPAHAIMPDNLPTREALRVHEFSERLGGVHSFSDGETLWVGHGYRSDNGWAYDTLEIDAATGEVRTRNRFDEWAGGVSWLQPQYGDRAFCWHDDTGLIIERDVRTGAEVRRIETPFRTVFDAKDDLTITVDHMSPLHVTGDQRWLLAFTEDGTLHSINLETGESRREWKYEGEREFEGHGIHAWITPLRGTNRLLLTDVPDGFDTPLRMWDQNTRTMTEFEKMPQSGWQDGRGDIAWQAVNNSLSIWNLEKRVEIELPVSEAPIAGTECDSDQTTMFIMRADGSVDVFRIVDGERLEPIHRLVAPTDKVQGYMMVLSDDDSLLYWQGMTPYRREDEEGEDLSVIAIFDVTGLTR